MIPRRSELARCRACGARILIALTPRGRRMPLDPKPSPTVGRLAAYRAHHVWKCRVIRPGESPARYEDIFVTHFATCPPRLARIQAKRQSKTVAAMSLVTSLDERRRRTQGGRPS